VLTPGPFRLSPDALQGYAALNFAASVKFCGPTLFLFSPIFRVSFYLFPTPPAFDNRFRTREHPSMHNTQSLALSPLTPPLTLNSNRTASGCFLAQIFLAGSFCRCVEFLHLSFFPPPNEDHALVHVRRRLRFFICALPFFFLPRTH